MMAPIAKDLITHLLCVDPRQRFTIDEFLAHPWCNAAPAPPPPPTPMGAPMDSPMLADHFRRGGRDGRSPGLASLKEAFDITYAVHRMEEEGQRKQAMGAGGRGALGELNEDDEELDEELVEDARRRHGEAQPAGHRKSGSSSSRHRGRSADPSRRHDKPGRDMDGGRAGQRDRGGNTFELNMDATTLLGRRHKRAVPGQAPIESSPLARQTIAGNGELIDAPQSPMHQ
jgi:hypothetical protein